MGRPFVTIAIPTFRRHDLLEVALKSAVRQDCDFEYEVIIVDNDPSSESRRVIEEMVAREGRGVSKYYQNTENIGMVGNWNRCLELTSGEYAAILSDDDAISSQYARIMAYWARRLDADMLRPSSIKIGADNAMIFSDGTEKIEDISATRYRPMEFMLKNTVAAPVGVLLRTSALRAKRLCFRQARYPSFDYDLWARMVCAGMRCFRIDAHLGFYRLLVNTSLKKRVVVGFAYQDRRIRKDIARRFPLLRLWHHLFGGLAISNAFVDSKRRYGTDLSLLFPKQNRNREREAFLYRKASRAVFRLIKR
jgi:glycosyltransferase